MLTDVLTCLANLSNDEVFTPPNLVNDILDLLPKELWSNPNTRFLYSVSKSGVFLREMAKHLMKGLESEIALWIYQSMEEMMHKKAPFLPNLSWCDLTTIIN